MPSPAAGWVRNDSSLIDRAPAFMNLRLRFWCWPFLLVLGGTAYPQGQPATHGGDFPLIKDAAQSITAGNLDRAERELQSVLQTSPEEFRALNLLGIIRAQQHREPEAERFFKRAIEIKPDFTSAHASLGMLYAQMSKPDEAIPELKEALRRLRIMRVLLSAHPDGMVVGDIGSELGIAASTLSHHLEKLKNEDLVKVRREGTYLWYSANAETLKQLLGFLYAECRS